MTTTRFLSAAVLCALAAAAVHAAEAQPKEEPPVGLDAEGQKDLDALLALQNDRPAFDQKLEALAKSGKYRSVFVLTHAMFRLPWIEALEPKGNGDTRMPKLAVEHMLDALVSAREHDKRSAAYFRALRDGKGVKEAEQNLLSWTKDNEAKMEWNGDSFAPKKEAPKEQE